jgi:phosphoglycerol transferase MdoB-like AlkP superfamily enzyme
MTLPHIPSGPVASFVLLAATILEVISAVVWFVQGIRRDPQDRVLRFQALAFGTFFLGLLVLKRFGSWWPLDLIWLALFFSLTGCVVYFGATEWLRRRKGPG